MFFKKKEKSQEEKFYSIGKEIAPLFIECTKELLMPGFFKLVREIEKEYNIEPQNDDLKKCFLEVLSIHLLFFDITLSSSFDDKTRNHLIAALMANIAKELFFEIGYPINDVIEHFDETRNIYFESYHEGGFGRLAWVMGKRLAAFAGHAEDVAFIMGAESYFSKILVDAKENMYIPIIEGIIKPKIK